MLQFLKSKPAIFNQFNMMSGLFEKGSQKQCVDFTVFGHQNIQTRACVVACGDISLLTGGICRALTCRNDTKWDFKPESAALIDHALHANFATHHFDKFFCNRCAESGATKTTCG